MPNNIKDIPQNIIDSIVDIATGSTFRKGFIFYFLIINLDFFLILFGKINILNNLREYFPLIYQDIRIQYWWTFLLQFIIKPSLFGFMFPVIFDSINVFLKYIRSELNDLSIKKWQIPLHNNSEEIDSYIKAIKKLQTESNDLLAENNAYKRSVQENEQSKPDKARPKRINPKVLL